MKPEPDKSVDSSKNGISALGKWWAAPIAFVVSVITSLTPAKNWLLQEGPFIVYTTIAILLVLLFFRAGQVVFRLVDRMIVSCEDTTVEHLKWEAGRTKALAAALILLGAIATGLAIWLTMMQRIAASLLHP